MDDDRGAERGILPSRFMRGLRPEFYSDTRDRTDYQLDAPLLAFHLDTLTQRNETHDFEIFCRKLSERAICPNLVPQTGPEGGGDSKADTETFPVADEISSLYYEGEANSGRERWAFAFSAKQRWKQKATDDVQGLIDTGRTYNRIICVTARAARAKDRAALETELSVRAGVPVTILDRSWIVAQVIEHGRKDLAVNYLGVGTEVADASELGPTDYSRLQQLEAIERELEDPAAYGVEQHRVVDSLLAAKLARGLERPRVEIDGRFARAIRLADQSGSLHQRVEARYEQIWTAYWWFDDFAFLETEYPVVEALAADASHARTLGFLVNLGQLLFNSVTHGHLDRVACQLDRRIEWIAALLRPMAADRERPNNRLEARAALLHLEMNQAVLAGDGDALSRVWHGFSEILDDADGMGEFDAERFAKLAEVAEGVAGDDPAYAALIDKLSEFVSARTGEAHGALILLRRAQNLDGNRHFEMIRLLSKAAMQLTKKEHSAEFSDALSYLIHAYRSAGLLWAARATCVMALSTMIIDAEEGDRLPPRFAVVAKAWAWLSLDLHHYPDFIVAIGLFKGTIEALPFRDEDREKLRRDAQELEIAAASRLINLSDAELARFACWPDLFEAAELFMPRTALLFTLGYEDVLRADGSIPAAETDQGARDMLSVLASQPVGAATMPSGAILQASGEPFRVSTRLLGMEVEVRNSGSDHAILAAEALVGSLEAFFATTIEHRVMPHTERFAIEIVDSADADAPRFTVDRERMTGSLVWPANLPPTRFGDQELIRPLWLDIAAQLLDATCFIPDADRTITTLTQGERVFGRMGLVTAAAQSYHRLIGRYLTRPGDLLDKQLRIFPPRAPRPAIEHVDLEALVAERSDRPPTPASPRSTAESHRDLGVRSVIDVHLWNQAKWRGAGFAQNAPGYPPFLALIFENDDAATKIFSRWRERIGPYDEQDRIRLSVIRHIPGHSPFHYSIQLSANALPGELETGQVIGFTARSMVVEPTSGENLENFLEPDSKVHQ
ncbi:hypothetical protein [Polymorphobacter megasporae]|uniref:hypothetical protein n=1 Tax=Glacieibacterium megasporae TaxID=2835787 RepID=UPI001CAA74BD|nr:hypothetical protein [Polymorphobacter megasporae]UAJ12433.1 hypothetical protein KTC28_21745 [Polymorphobacter megasporae]